MVLFVLSVVGQIDGGELARWLTADPIDWSQGAVLAALGLVGALITVFTLVGGAVPGTAGEPAIVAGTERLERLTRRLEQLVDTQPPDSPAITAVEGSVNSLRSYLSRERWRQFALAALLYAVLGAAAASLLADDIIQAIVVGAGWTGFLGLLGLRRDREERQTIRNAELSRVTARLEDLRSAVLPETVAPGAPGQTMSAMVDEMTRDVTFAQKI